MRWFLILLLSMAIPLNAAYAAAAGVCDGVAGHVPHGEHFGHHTHVHDHDHEHAQPGSGDPVQPGGGDHSHCHAHPLFSLMLPAPIEVHLPCGARAAAPVPPDLFGSVTPGRLERPPRFVLVA